MTIKEKAPKGLLVLLMVVKILPVVILVLTALLAKVALLAKAQQITVAKGKEIKETIMDENVKMPDIAVNEHYPDGVPVTTMPAQLLETLPKLPEYMEYHFVGKKLVLVDSAAGLVVDFTPDVLQ